MPAISAGVSFSLNKCYKPYLHLMKTKIHYWLGVFLCLISSAAFAQQPVEEWARRYDSKGPTTETPGDKMVAVDEIGNIYVTGTSHNSNTGIGKIITIKYSPTGEELWVKEYGKEGLFNTVTGLAVDSNNGVYITGNEVTIRYDASSGNLSWEIFNRIYSPSIAVDNRNGLYISGSVFNNDTGWDYTTIRYDAASGEKDWESLYNGENNNSEFSAAIAVDNNGGVYVTGTSYGENAAGSAYVTVRYDAATGTKTWDNSFSQASFFWKPYIDVDNMGGVFVTGTTYNDMTGYDITTIRYDAATGEQKWSSSYNGEGNGSDRVRDIAVDNQGNVFVTGVSGDTYIESKYITISYDGDTGEQLWATTYSDEGNTTHWATAIAVDDSGVYVTGSSRTGSNSNQFTTIRYDATSGSPLWISSYKGKEKGSHEATGIVLDNHGGVIVTGYDFTKKTSRDLITIRYKAATGDRDWEQRYNSFGSQSDGGIAIAVDAAGNSYVTGTSSNYNYSTGMDSIVTIKYSPTGEELWVQVYGKGLSSSVRAIAIDHKGGVYVAGTSIRESTGSEFVTIRYDAITGHQDWNVHYDGDKDGWNEAVDIAVDNESGVYVTGRVPAPNNAYNYATIRYDAATGEQIWSATFSGAEDSYNTPAAIAADNTGGVYVTGTNNGDFLTLRYDAATGEQEWASPYNGEGNEHDGAVDIAVDNQGSVYVTGISRGIDTFFDYVTVRYNAATGEQKWVSRYDAGRNGYDYVKAIAVDDHGVYITGNSQSIGGEEVEYAYDFVTVGYDAATGNQKWVSRYDGDYNDLATAIAVDNAGGVYVTGHSEVGRAAAYSTLKYNATDGAQVWAIQTDEGGWNDTAMDLALDSEGNIIVTGYSFHPSTGNDFLTVKYSQGQCPALADVAIQGNSTAAVNTKASVYTLTESGATAFAWTITDGKGSHYTNFTGQGTSSISINWPSSPNVYKVSVTYGGGAGCPTQDTTLYVHVFNPEAGFVTGGGWINSPTNIDYEFMQKGTRASFGLMARYKKGEENQVQGQTHLLLENSSFYFRSTQQEARTLVISGNQAFYRGSGKVTYRTDSGKLVTDPRQFTFLVAATDGGQGKSKNPDMLRIIIWEMNEDGSRGVVVYDNQPACGAGNLDENVVACYPIGGGNIVIHTPNLKSASTNASLAAEATPPGLEAYPTAFSDRTTIAFATEQDTDYTLELYDLKGALVQEIKAGSAKGGQRYEQELRAGNLPKGLYLVRLSTADFVQTVKLVVQH
jgi:uncharacterized delta-60 repeat protein